MKQHRWRCVAAASAMCGALLGSPGLVVGAPALAPPSGAGDVRPQCAHWCVLHCCRMLGVPMEMATALELLPARPEGHSMLEVASALGRVGLCYEGRLETFEELRAGLFPVIAHVKGRQQGARHFVVVEKAGEQVVRFLDGSGRPTVSAADAFRERWTGRILRVWVDPDESAASAFLPPPGRPAPRIRFQTLLIDKGEVPSSGGAVVFVFPFRNVGDADLVVEKVVTNCPCLGAEKPGEAVPPGQGGQIALSYDPGRRRGPFRYSAVVKTNDPCTPLARMLVAGNTGQAVRVEPPRLDFGRVIQGRRSVALLAVTCRGDMPLALSQGACSVEGVRATSCPLTADLVRRLWPGVQGQVLKRRNTSLVEVSYTPGGSTSGRVDASLRIGTNVKGFEELAIPMSAVVVTPVVAFPDQLVFGEVAEDQQCQQDVTMVSLEGADFRVLSVASGDDGVSCSYPEGLQNGAVRLRFAAKGRAAGALDGKNVEIKVELARPAEQVAIHLPVVAIAKSAD